MAIGGGTGLPQVLRALGDLGFDIDAIVTMADDGGSSGILRHQLGILPPGDVRNCLVALAEDESSELARLLQYRFAEGEGLAGHALGNLVLAALTDIAGGFVEAIRVVERALSARGHVHPSTLADVRLHGIDTHGEEVFGQARLAANPSTVHRVFLEPADAPANPAAVEAIGRADAVVIGPGSLFTSIIPNFLVTGILEAVRTSRASVVYVCNVANLRGETAGMDVADHADALMRHGLDGAIDVVVAHSAPGSAAAPRQDPGPAGRSVEPVRLGPEQVARLRSMGIRVVCADLADPEDPVRHARGALARVLEEVLA